MSKTDSKPHRRLSLTLPTLPHPTEDIPATDETSSALTSWSDATPTQIEAAPSTPDSPSPSSVRVMAYLTPEEGQLLDDLWMTLRRSQTRASKSDILRAALTLAGNQKEELRNVIANQHVSTLIRQRDRKTAR